jgi:hypothetical protein
MTTRKTYFGGVLLAVLVLTAGCSGILGEDQSFEATEISVSDDALNETGYGSAEEREYTFNETIELDGNETEVSMTSHLAGYQKSYANGTGYFVALATPKAPIAGIDANPLGSADQKRLVSEAISRSGEAGVDVSADDIQVAGNTSVTILDTDATVVTYNTTIEQSSTEKDMRVHATRIEHGDDHVVAVGVTPVSADGATDDVITLFEGIEHDTEE